MTSQRLHGILKIVDSLDRELCVQTALETVREALGDLASSPAQPNYQRALAAALASFSTAAAKMAESLSPWQAAAIQQMGGAEFFDGAIAEKVTDAIQSNAMTPSVARDIVQNLAARRAAFLGTVRNALQALEKLGITDSGLKPGIADVAFVIPRKLFGNELGSFAKELVFINRLVQDFAEAQTGKAEPVTLRQLSSSTPTVTLQAPLPALQMLATVIQEYLEAWDRMRKIRLLRAQLADMGLKGKTALQELTDEITTSVAQVVEESTGLVINDNKANQTDLANAVRSDIRRLFGQIERGLTVEFHANPQGATGADQETLQKIAHLGKQLKFPQTTSEPLLLKSEEILEDAVRPAGPSRKTTTHKTLASKKQSQENIKQD